jgi:hypothetical protein
MELLILILLKLGVYYSPDHLAHEQNTGTESTEVIYAQHIIDDNLYHYDEDGGVVIEDDVDPHE